jgi:catalase
MSAKYPTTNGARAAVGSDEYSPTVGSQQVTENLTEAEAAALTAEDSDHLTLDLFEAIERRDFPKWTVSVQVMPYDEAKTYRMNPFDLTKTWPHSDYPLVKVGEFVLDSNPENYFAEIEQAAFERSNLVPGIDVSPDKMLLARVFAYADAHRYRIGSNYNELPVNRPHGEVHSYTKDGQLRHYFKPGTAPIYAPNFFGGPTADSARAVESSGWHADGELMRSAYTRRAEDDDFRQAGVLVQQVFSEAQSARLVQILVGRYRQLRIEEIRKRFLWYWNNIDPDTAAKITNTIRPTL